MNYLGMEFDGQPLGAIVPLAAVGEGGVGLGNPIMLPSDPCDVELAFTSFDEVAAHITRSRPMKEAITDTTYPHTAASQQLWAKAIYKALLNRRDVVDGDKLVKQWESMIGESKVNIELVAWRTLRRVMLYHNLEGKLEPDNLETRKFRNWESFADHMGYILDALAVKKTLCRHLATDTWTAAFIDAPELHSSRVDNNRKINDAKRAKVDAGIAALKHVKKVVETGTLQDPEEAASIIALADKAAAPIFRAKLETTISASTRSRRRKSTATAKTTTKSSNKPTLRERKTASRRIKAAGDMINADEDAIDEEDLDAIGSPDLSMQYSVPPSTQWSHRMANASIAMAGIPPIAQMQGYGNSSTRNQSQGYQASVWNPQTDLYELPAAGASHFTSHHHNGYIPGHGHHVSGPLQGQTFNSTSAISHGVNNFYSHNPYASNYPYSSIESHHQHTQMPGAFPQELPSSTQNIWGNGQTSSADAMTNGTTAPGYWSTTTASHFPQHTFSHIPTRVPINQSIYQPNVPYASSQRHPNGTAAIEYNNDEYDNGCSSDDLGD